ncbi:hypothetical protein GSI_03839 [Ganoderma sinense ZZ0214-1]|uniref:Uncharacterized protein n=1 Tax=Ganoderma sinense ZZ0214-1 TaxID=1077348 RepID=A0A2G8SKN5_9APHY|nr:hypothetical protein GSI_03839 [Ganoderma sinense ZZ0214-1]
MNTPHTPGAHLSRVPESDETVAWMNHSTVISMPLIRLTSRNKKFQQQLRLALPRIIGGSWGRYASFLLLSTSFTDCESGSFANHNAPALTVAYITVIVHSLNLSVILFVCACPTDKTAKSLVQVPRLTDQ